LQWRKFLKLGHQLTRIPERIQEEPILILSEGGINCRRARKSRGRVDPSRD